MSRDHAAAGVDEWDKVGAVNEPLFEAWERYWETAQEYGLCILTTLHESFYADYAPYRNKDVMEKMVVPLYGEGEIAKLPEYRRRFLEGNLLEDRLALFTDPAMMQVQQDYLADLIPRLRDHPAVLLYELENEQEVGFYDWTNKNVRWIRRHDSKTPIGISHSGAGLMTADPLPHTRKTNIDFYSYHVYPVDDVTTETLDYSTAVSMTARYARLGVPAGCGESGSHILPDGPQGAWRRALARDTAWLIFLASNNHVFFWDGGHPETSAFRTLAEVAQMLNLRSYKRKQPRIAINVSHPLDDDIYFRSEQGRRLYQTMGQYEEHFQRLGVDFDFTFGEGDYDVVLPGARFEAFEPKERSLNVSNGYLLRPLSEANDETVVAYIRNQGQNVKQGKEWHSGWLRKPEAAPLALEVALPGVYEGFLHTFEVDARQDVHIDGTGRIKAPASENDYLLFLKKT
jgi:hypothetical protein